MNNFDKYYKIAIEATSQSSIFLRDNFRTELALVREKEEKTGRPQHQNKVWCWVKIFARLPSREAGLGWERVNSIPSVALRALAGRQSRFALRSVIATLI